MNALDCQVAYWDGVAAERAFTHPLDSERFRALTNPDTGILDYGCGYGRTCAELASLGYRHVTGVDISKAMIARGHARFPDLDLREHANLPLPFVPDSFDVCIVFAVLTCIPSDGGHLELIGELRRVLRSDGLLYISDYPLQLDDRNQRRYREFQGQYGSFGVFRLPDGGVVRHHDMTWIHELLAGFVVLSERELETPTMSGNPAKVFQILARKRHQGSTTGSTVRR